MATKSHSLSTSSASAKSRRSNKPLMEKKRRERINKSLNSLKELVLIAEQRDISKFNKLEKADILEMTVRHVRFLHEKNDVSNRKDECIAKYKEGFDRCLTEVVNYLKSVNGVTSDIASGVVAFLQSISQSISEGASCPHSTNGKSESKIKAVIDTSVFRSGVIRHEEERVPSSPSIDDDNNSLQQQHQQHQHQQHQHQQQQQQQQRCTPLAKTTLPDGQSIKVELMVPNWSSTSAPVSFPPSPPDSSRCSSSPDSLRGSPRLFWDQGASVHNMDRQPCTTKMAISGKEENHHQHTHPFPPLQSPSQENTPLNLSISSSSSSRSGESVSPLPPFTPAGPRGSPAPVVIIKQERYNPLLSLLPAASTSPFLQGKSGGQYRERIDNAHTLEAEPCRRGVDGSSGHSFKSWNRPTPYPKKDAAKRYQNQNLANANQCLPSASPRLPSSSDSPPSTSASSSHWRPW